MAELRAAGCAKVYREKVSGAKSDRPELAKLLRAIEPGDVLLFDSYVPHASKPNFTDAARRILYLTYNRASDGDYRAQYYADKRASFPPEIEREPGVEYKFRV